MTESTWDFSNDWGSLSGPYPHICFIEFDVEARHGDWLYIHAALLGFRVTYMRWSPVPVESLGREHAP